VGLGGGHFSKSARSGAPGVGEHDVLRFAQDDELYSGATIFIQDDGFLFGRKWDAGMMMLRRGLARLYCAMVWELGFWYCRWADFSLVRGHGNF
jgi:hypothetical protein